MKYLWLISLLIFIFINPCKAQEKISTPCYTTNRNDSSGLYTVNLSIYNNNFSGLLLFKKTSDSSIRAVLTTEMGPKILDLELYNTKYKVNYTIKQLNKKIILKSLYTDFASISGILRYNNKDERYFLQHFDTLKNCFVTELLNKKGRELEICYFCNKTEKSADSVFLQHFNFKMTMELRKINY